VEDGLQRYLKSFGVAKSEALPLMDHPALDDLLFLAKNPGMQARLNPIFMNL